MKTRTALVSTLAAGLGLLACNKAADTLGPSENPTGTATLAARLSAVSAEAKTVLRQTQIVRATLDTGAPEGAMKALPVAVVDYDKGKVSFPSLRVGVSYVLKLEGVVEGRTLWSVTHNGILGANGNTDNSPKFEVTTDDLALKAPRIERIESTASLISLSNWGLGAKLYWTRDTTKPWTQGTEVTLNQPDELWAKDSIEGVAGSAWTLLKVDGNGSLLQDTLKAPAIALADPQGNPGSMKGWAKLKLTDSAVGLGGELQYTLDTNAAWRSWNSDTTRLFGSGTVWARAYKNGSFCPVAVKSFAVTPLEMPKPSVVADSSQTDSTKVTLSSNFSLGQKYTGATLYYSNGSGFPWLKFTSPLYLKSNTTLRVKDSLVGQISLIDTIQITVRTSATVPEPAAGLGVTGSLTFTGPISDSFLIQKQYGIKVKSYRDSLTSTALSITNTGALRVTVKWGAVPVWGANAQIQVPLNPAGTNVDFSKVTGVTFKFRTSDAKTTVLFGPQSTKYIGDPDSLVMRAVNLGASTAGKTQTVSLPGGIAYMNWMTDQHPNMATQSWEEVSSSVPYLVFQPMAVYNATGDAVTVPTSWLEISDLQLVAPGALPLQPGN